MVVFVAGSSIAVYSHMPSSPPSAHAAAGDEPQTPHAQAQIPDARVSDCHVQAVGAGGAGCESGLGEQGVIVGTGPHAYSAAASCVGDGSGSEAQWWGRGEWWMGKEGVCKVGGWKVGLKVSWDVETPAVAVPMYDREAYVMLPGFNQAHQHCVIVGTDARFSSTHRVATMPCSSYHRCLP